MWFAPVNIVAFSEGLRRGTLGYPAAFAWAVIRACRLLHVPERHEMAQRICRLAPEAVGDVDRVDVGLGEDLGRLQGLLRLVDGQARLVTEHRIEHRIG